MLASKHGGPLEKLKVENFQFAGILFHSMPIFFLYELLILYFP